MNAGIFSCWFEIIQLNALSFYRVDVGTNQIGKISAIVGYLDGSQLSGELKAIMPFLNIGLFVLELVMIGMMCACCFLFRFIIASQPSNIFQIVGAIIAIINLIIFFSKSFVLNTVIYNFNPKNGSLLSNP
ncbi:MAG: hypothetical protein EZS28_030662 [Streblomastix strix]|uniref:Uncharacterized protein n=1 Tax=Streblomastix strix TaxID=222440 RepID=A0A5J4UVD3_9EUKA|nr:MAG: hypothetical protein EZS28_030662 [Streblomastix strix]